MSPRQVLLPLTEMAHRLFDHPQGRGDRRCAVAATIRTKCDNHEPDGFEQDFPTVHDGARGVHFIEKAVESSRSEKKWLDTR